MDEQSKQELAKIVELGVDSLTVAQLDFLRARRQYLNKTQHKEFDAAIKQRDAEAAQEAKQDGKEEVE